MNFASDDAVFYNSGEFATDVVFQRLAGGDPISTRAVIERAIDDMPDNFRGVVQEGVITASLPFAAIGKPVRGDTITAGVMVYVVDGVVSNNGLDVVVTVRES